MKSLNELRNEALEIASSHGFTEASVPEDIALMHSELSEALEDFRSGLKPDVFVYIANENGPFEEKAGDKYSTFYPGTKPCGIPIEMADLLIRVFHFCGKHKIDIERAVNEKMEYNKSRPYKHNKII